MKVNQTVDEELRKNTMFNTSMRSCMPTFLAHYDEKIKDNSPSAQFVDLLENGSLVV